MKTGRIYIDALIDDLEMAIKAFIIMFFKVDNTILEERRDLLMSQIEAPGKIFFFQGSAVNNDVKSP